MVEDFFEMNGYLWSVKIVEPNSPYLVDRTNTLTVATTDTKDLCIYLSSNLYGDFLLTVLIHELGHCALFSFDLLKDIERMIKPEYWIEAEEWVCNFIADYGLKIFKSAYSILGTKAWRLIPKEINKFLERRDIA